MLYQSGKGFNHLVEKEEISILVKKLYYNCIIKRLRMKQLIFNCFIAGVWVKMREFYSVRVFVYVTVYIIHLLPYILEYLQVDSLVPCR